MTAASKKEESSGNDLEGGIFTFNFRMTLEKYLGPQHANAAATWDRILSEAQVQTIKTAANGLCPYPDNPNKYRDCDQKPLVKIN